MTYNRTIFPPACIIYWFYGRWPLALYPVIPVIVDPHKSFGATGFGVGEILQKIFLSLKSCLLVSGWRIQKFDPKIVPRVSGENSCPIVTLDCSGVADTSNIGSGALKAKGKRKNFPGKAMEGRKGENVMQKHLTVPLRNLLGYLLSSKESPPGDWDAVKTVSSIACSQQIFSVLVKMLTLKML